ncbi:prolyl oligopeptidase family serine peptidase [Mariniflexile sp. HMF6888]|uniref:S9 family peptidase n=1 Tax=Mariniflexile sp. HMF6888 TaxID=3373086 RepID=UPI00379CFD84
MKTKVTRFLTKRNHSAHFIDHLEKKNVVWSPDGRYIAYTHAESTDISSNNQGVRVINRLLYKTKGGRSRSFYNDNLLTHVYIIRSDGGIPQKLTQGDFNNHSIAWSPDSTHIAFISNRSADEDDNQFNDLWKVDIAGKKTTRLTKEFGTAFQPIWSPDGAYIAYLAVSDLISTNDSLGADTHIQLVPADGGKSEYLTKSLDRRIENICWHPNSKDIYFTAGNQGITSIYAVSIISLEINVIIDDNGCIHNYSLHPNGVDFAYTCSNVTHPAKLYLSKDFRKTRITISQENNEWLEQTTMVEAETLWFNSFDGTRVQGWLLKPIDFNPEKTYPLILVIHGGPHNMFGHEFDIRMQLLTNAGYGVLYINPRGSHGYGQKFSYGNIRDWGGGDYQDLMLGLDETLRVNKWINADLLGVTGQSYGGYMVNWIITQTNRFKAAVTDGGICNLISFAGTSLYHSLIESEFRGKAYDNYELLWHCSPIRNITNASTPTLILHGEIDNEVPLSQGDEMFVALKKCKVETEYVQYLGEGHGWRPELTCENQRDLNRRIIDWFDRFIVL